jgi:tetratricopeptide (TPR) repeat protein
MGLPCTLIALAIFVVTVPFVAVADSQNPRGAGEPREAAEREYQEAQRSFEAGEYRRALRLFQRAQDAAPNAETLYSMALCNVELGRYDRAVEIYDSLMQDYPRYSDREGVALTLTELRARIADLEEPNDAPSRGPTVIAGRNAYVSGGGDMTVYEGNRTDVHVQATRMTRGRKISWGVLTSGLAITAIGAGLLIRGAVLHQEFEETNRGFLTGNVTGWKSADHDLAEMAETGENLFDSGWSLTISGLAMACASILLFVFIDGEEIIPSEVRSRVNARLSLAGLNFTGSF